MVAIVSDDYKVLGSPFQSIPDAAAEKERLSKLSLVLLTISCEIDGLDI